VPFRLTRNLSAFITPFLVDGVFSATINAINLCLCKCVHAAGAPLTIVALTRPLAGTRRSPNQDILRNFLNLHIREDLLSWNTTKLPQNVTDAVQRQMEAAARDKINQNVALIMKRIAILTPQQPLQQQQQPAQPGADKVQSPAAAEWRGWSLTARVCRAAGYTEHAAHRAHHAEGQPARALRHCQEQALHHGRALDAVVLSERSAPRHCVWAPGREGIGRPQSFVVSVFNRKDAF
jgi:hypothetical protein